MQFVFRITEHNLKPFNHQIKIHSALAKVFSSAVYIVCRQPIFNIRLYETLARRVQLIFFST